MSYGDMTIHEQFRTLYCDRSIRGISGGGGTVYAGVGSLYVNHQEVL